MLCCGLRLKRSSKRPKSKYEVTPSGENEQNEPTVEQKNEQKNEQQPQASVSQFAKDMLERHNMYRSHHGSPPLELSVELTDSAQRWAESMAKSGTLDHDESRQKSQVGENVALKYNSAHSDFPASAFVDSWYSEAADYKFDGTEDQINCGHFTQVVWKSSREAGFGKCIADSGKVFVCGRYRPPGNFSGYFSANVLSPAGGEVLKLETEEGKPTPVSITAVVPVIGPNDPRDVMTATETVTKTVGEQKVVKITETYRTPSGETYTKSMEK